MCDVQTGTVCHFEGIVFDFFSLLFERKNWMNEWSDGWVKGRIASWILNRFFCQIFGWWPEEEF